MPGYELVFIVQPELEEEAVTALVDKVTQTISELKGQVNQVDSWGKRRLAYPIKKYLEGLYFLMQVQLPTTAVRELERALKLMEDIIRYLIVRKDEAETN